MVLLPMSMERDWEMAKVTAHIFYFKEKFLGVPTQGRRQRKRIKISFLLKNFSRLKNLLCGVASGLKP